MNSLTTTRALSPSFGRFSTIQTAGPVGDSPTDHPSTDESAAPPVEEAIAAAKRIAGDRSVTIASADIIQQALNRGLVDEIGISLVPVLSGNGIRYFGEIVGGHIMLGDPIVVQGIRALHLRYPVRGRPASAT